MATKTISEQRTYSITVCDVCGEPTNKKCFACRRDLCDRHVRVLDKDPFSDYIYSDCPEALCEQCEAIIEPYKKRASEILAQADSAIERLEAEFCAKCREKQGDQ